MQNGSDLSMAVQISSLLLEVKTIRRELENSKKLIHLNNDNISALSALVLSNHNEAKNQSNALTLSISRLINNINLGKYCCSQSCLFESCDRCQNDERRDSDVTVSNNENLEDCEEPEYFEVENCFTDESTDIAHQQLQQKRRTASRQSHATLFSATNFIFNAAKYILIRPLFGSNKHINQAAATFETSSEQQMETHPSLKEGHTSKDILSNDCATLAQLQTSELKLSQPKTTDFTFSQKLRGEICQATQSQLKMTPRALNLLPTPSLKKIDEEEEEEDELNTGKQKTKFYNSAERHIGIVEQEKNSRIFIRQNSALGSATNIAFSVAKEMLIGSEKSLLTRATSSFYESCSNPQNEKTVNTVNLLLGNVVSSVIPAQSIRRDFALNIAHQFSPPSATPLWGKQSKLFSIDNLPLAILIIILRFAVDPLLPNAKIYVAKWHCQRISVYNLRQLSRALKNAVPEALKLIDTRDISMKALQSLATASETEFAQIQPYQRRITITASIPSTATTKTSNPTTLTVPAAGLLFIQPPSQTVYTSPSQTFKPPILPSGRSVRTTITASYVIPTATGVDPPAAAATAAHATISVPFALHLQIDNDPVATATVRAILTLTVARAEQTQRVVELVDTSTGAWIGWIRYSEAEAPGYNYNVKHREVLECTWEREWWLGWAAKWAIGMPRHDREDILDRHFGHVASEIVLEEIVVPTDFVFGGFLKSVLE